MCSHHINGTGSNAEANGIQRNAGNQRLRMLRYLAMLKWATILTASLALLLGPHPMSVCAVLAGLPADCIPQPENHCNPTQKPDSPPAKNSSTDLSCCQVAAAPAPSASNKIELSAAALPPLETAAHWQPDLSISRSPISEVEPDRSPPDRQSLLCVFLI